MSVYQGRLECAWCGHVWKGTIHIKSIHPAECPKCGRFAGKPAS